MLKHLITYKELLSHNSVLNEALVFFHSSNTLLCVSGIILLSLFSEATKEGTWKRECESSHLILEFYTIMKIKSFLSWKTH